MAFEHPSKERQVARIHSMECCLKFKNYSVRSRKFRPVNPVEFSTPRTSAKQNAAKVNQQPDKSPRGRRLATVVNSSPPRHSFIVPPFTVSSPQTTSSLPILAALQDSDPSCERHM